MIRIVFGIILGIGLVPLAAMAWLHFGHPPVAVADPPFPYERQITQVPLNLRIDREMPKTSPIQVDEPNLIVGAQIYRDECSACHGLYLKPSPLAKHVFPAIPQLWEKHRNSSVIGVSDDPLGETFWKVTNGIRLTGMPSYKGLLSETQIWQVSLLLANADKPLPPGAISLVMGGSEPPAPAPKTSAKPVPAAKPSARRRNPRP
jgi:thiosulfate dehydrogenase